MANPLRLLATAALVATVAITGACSDDDDTTPNSDDPTQVDGQDDTADTSLDDGTTDVDESGDTGVPTSSGE